jgi:hypothetical protein
MALSIKDHVARLRQSAVQSREFLGGAIPPKVAHEIERFAAALDDVAAHLEERIRAAPPAKPGKKKSECDPMDREHARRRVGNG